MDVSLVIEHTWISVVGWLLGISAGSLAGYGTAHAVRRIFIKKPGLRRWSILLPWRTVVASLIVLLWFPLIIMMYFGLGASTVVASVSLAITLLTMMSTLLILLDHWFPVSPLIRFVAAVRTLGVLSPVFGLFVGVFSGGGIGFATLSGVRLLKYDLAFRYALSLFLMVLVFDVLTGVAQFAAVDKLTEKT